MKRLVVFAVIVAGFVLCVMVLFQKLEGREPVIDVTLPSLYLKKEYQMDLEITDRGSGLRSLRVALIQQNNETVLLEKKYPSDGILGFFNTQKQMSDKVLIPVESWRYGMTDGEARIQIKVTDNSWRGWNKGNQAFIEKEVVIDTKPPRIQILSRQHNVEKGGSGLVIYEVFEDEVKTGVMVGDHFFPGGPGLFTDSNIHSTFFALDYSKGPGTSLAVVATDIAGNQTRRGFHHYIRDADFKTDVLNISDNFLELVIEGFDTGGKAIVSSGPDSRLLDKFLYINSELRKQNNETILSKGKLTQNVKMWEGGFLQLPNSARRASFADHRTYRHNGKDIGKAVHLGVDLASVANAEIPAANSGKVVFTGFEGIFGNSVVIDHGFGLMSLYAHLNEIHVEKDMMVKKGVIIGRTGMTGLAGGDHLHFSMMVHDVFVNPMEWWDPSWIENNIMSKIQNVRQRSQ